MLSPYFQESINTMKAGWFELACAKMFGKKTVGRDGCYSATVSYWRGHYYLIDFQETIKAKNKES